MSQPHSKDDLALYPVDDCGAPRTLVDILESTTATHPAALAIDNGTDRLTYAELAARIGERVQQLRAAGVGAGDRIGVRVSSGSLELYISILAVITAGAAYVPVDVDDPDERAKLVWEEAHVTAVFTDNATLTPFNPSLGGEHRKPGLEDDAWIIFTSGSTGKPKGVAVTHRSAAAFVDAESKIFLPEKPLAPGDRVLAGLSVAFDASCEEMWLAWRYGACLVPAPRALVKAGADLGTFLTAQGISVVSTVPTLAAMWPAEALRGLRLLILGGEACPPELATRLANTVGSVWNTYGPTEATVVACAAPLVAGQPVAIGLPLAGWKLAVVDAEGNTVRWGEEGELVIGGVGMARYLDAEKDAVKFAPAACFGGERAYRSGDLVRAERSGLFFVGRNDEQIKLGGRRIELGEIDAALMTLPGVSAGATAIRRSETGNQVLVGYVVRTGAPQANDRGILRRVLPATLIPMLVTVDDLPVRTSGKVDRKALPWPPPASSHVDAQPVHGTTAWLAEQWRRVIGVPAAPDSDFFDIGGTSLAAAQLVSQLRQRAPTMSVADVYEYPVLSAMAARVDDLAGTKQEDRYVKPTARWVMFVQACILVCEITFNAGRWLAGVSAMKKFFAIRLGPDSWAGTRPLPWWAIVLIWVLFMTFPGRLVTTALGARLLTWGIKPGTYRRSSGTHLRLWGAERFAAMGNLANIAGTQWVRVYARMLGCHVGKDVQFHGLPPTTGLASFGDGCAVEPEVDTAGWWLDGDFLHIGFISVGEGAVVGHRSTLMPGAIVEPYATVEGGTVVEGTVQGPDVTPSSADEKAYMKERTFFLGLLYTLTLLVLDFLPIIPAAPTLALTPLLVRNYDDLNKLVMTIIEVSIPGFLLGMMLYIAISVFFVRLASLWLRPGSYSWHGMSAWAAWITHGTMMQLRTILFPFYASLMTPMWLRLFGARIGKYVEASTVVAIPSLLTVHDAAFLADDVCTSPFELCRGSIRVGASSVGEKAFVGNSGIVEAGVHVPEGSLVGVLGTAPHDMEAGSSWLGRPAISLPRKQDIQVDDSLTFKPPFRLVLFRGVIELCRLTPLMIGGLMTTLIATAYLWTLNRFGFWQVILAGPAMLFTAGFLSLFITTAVKWLLTPRITPGMHRPLWSSFVWRNELADTFIQSLALPWMINTFYGTPLLVWWMRTLGAKIGHGVWLDSHHLPEAELCEIGDGATVNRRAVLQTHLFHDRIMRLDKVVLEAGATLGPRSIALPATTIGAGTTIAPSSLVMRGENLPPGTRWMGNPVRPWVEAKKVESSESSEASDWESKV
ncbi:putative NRPS-like protein biosynthetic cluster [Claviceps pusilla]|uniref:NRPS-like protein biosynthetic cluster n=1 Tax=Claviceps pusilla TaxID=123648 RepID=A0A9P7N5Y8_9HYPO|nr:putative NRPS-like protein biosynthetic cluster [Claviceps pusilla]